MERRTFKPLDLLSDLFVTTECGGTAPPIGRKVAHDPNTFVVTHLQVGEGIIVNEYTFTEGGRRFG